ncbi:hypothetical protein FNF28_04951 [Cafeteria roenbergensis]|uniref:Uncharacterized protein n=1 Tax=Cafeteria roenbergensis TaxID=33653 RepID=A0A5A8DB21_CAFRO|nr:hypothetical protein FNF28_04951 [Cafeteria roenbergensis]
MGNERFCSPTRLFNVAGQEHFATAVRGGFDIYGQDKAALVMQVFVRALSLFFDLPMPNLATDSMVDLTVPRTYGERSNDTELRVGYTGQLMSATTDLVYATRFRFYLYCEPYEGELYHERVQNIENAYIDLDKRGNPIRRGVYGVDTLFQAGDEDKFLNEEPTLRRRAAASNQAPAGSRRPMPGSPWWGPPPARLRVGGRVSGSRMLTSRNVTAPLGRPLPDGSGSRFYLNDLLQREGVNNTGIVRVDDATWAGEKATRTFTPARIVIYQQPNKTSSRDIENNINFPVQPVVAVHDRHNRRVRLFEKPASIFCQLDPDLYPPYTPDLNGRYVDLFGEQDIPLTYINSGKAFFYDLSISSPVPEGLELQFTFRSTDPKFEDVNLPMVRSQWFVVEEFYVAPPVVVPRVPFPPALAVLLIFGSVAVLLAVSYFGLKWYRKRKQERHVVPAHGKHRTAAQKKQSRIQFEDGVGMQAHVEELQPGYVDPTSATPPQSDNGVSLHAPTASVVGGSRRVSDDLSVHQPATPPEPPLEPGAVLSTLGNADTSRAFDMLQLGMGKPTPASKLPATMQQLHAEGRLGIPHVYDDCGPAAGARAALCDQGNTSHRLRGAAEDGSPGEATGQRPKLTVETNRPSMEIQREAATEWAGRPRRVEVGATDSDEASGPSGPKLGWLAKLGRRVPLGGTGPTRTPESPAPLSLTPSSGSGSVRVPVFEGPRPRPAEAYMEKPAARSISERHHLASRSIRRHSARLALRLGLAKAAARLFPAEDVPAVFEASTPTSPSGSQDGPSIVPPAVAEAQEESESSSGTGSDEGHSPRRGAGASASENESIMDAVGLDSQVTSARQPDSEAGDDALQEVDLS